MITSASVTSRSILFSSDEEYRTASEGGRRESGEWSEILISPPLLRNCEWSIGAKVSNWPESRKHEWSELPPSPPLTRTAFSKVKARSRSSSHSRICKRSRSSPPNSEDSTLDSIKLDDLPMTYYKLNLTKQGNNQVPRNECLSKTSSNPLVVDIPVNEITLIQNQTHINESTSNSLLVILECQENEIENLKSQLKTVRTELVNAESKICKLKQHKNEALFRGNQIDELLGRIQMTEQQRNKYMEDLDKMKKLYNHEKKHLECKFLETEKILRETTERSQMLTNELSSSHVTQEHLQAEITTLSDRLAQGLFQVINFLIEINLFINLNIIFCRN
jgi:flagellar biosynthesis chaperone FliJ